MTRLSIALATANAMRLVMLVLMSPVMMSVLGRCVATIEVDAGCAGELRDAHDRVLDLLGGDHHEVGELVDDDDEVGHRLDTLGGLAGLTIELYWPMLRAPDVCSRLSRSSISATDQASALAACFGSVTTGT